jgi:hypothetical protein
MMSLQIRRLDYLARHCPETLTPLGTSAVDRSVIMFQVRTRDPEMNGGKLWFIAYDCNALTASLVDWATGQLFMRKEFNSFCEMLKHFKRDR